MKKIEEIEKEYASFRIKSSFVKNKEEFEAFIQVGIDDIDDAEVSYKKELRENRLWQLEAKIRNFFFFLFQQEEEQLYSYDNDILKEVIKLTEKYKKYYQRAKELVNDHNFLELTKFIDFISDYYSRHMEYFEFSRDQLDAQAMGFNLYNPKMEDNRKIVDMFVESKLSKIEEKPYQYEKKEKLHD